MKDTTRVGDIACSAVAFGLMRKGHNVLRPISDGLLYDLVIEKNGKFSRVQCKNGLYKNGAIIFRNYTNKQGGKSCIDYVGSVEYFGVYCTEIDKIYLIPIKDCNSRVTNLRVESPKNNEKKRTRWAYKYEI